MKKSLLILLTCMTSSVLAQEFKPFKVNLSLGYAQATGTGLSGGIGFSLEPKIGLSSHTDLGFRFEQAYLVRGVNYTGSANTATGSVAGFGSYVLTATHLFGETNTRPFLGLGAGVFTIESAGMVQVSPQQTPAELPITSYNTIGAMFRAGLKSGHFVASVEYNSIPPHVYQLANTTAEFTTKSSYVGFKVGIDIGGGRR